MRGAHALDQGVGHLQLADFFRFAFDVNRPRGIEGGEFLEEEALEHLLRRLRTLRQVTEHRAAMRGELFEVEDLRARAAQRAEEAALAAGRAVDDDEIERGRKRLSSETTKRR